MYIITGKKRSGKDTAANVLKMLGYEPYALAAPIKKILLNAFSKNGFNITNDMINGIEYDREQPLGISREYCIAIIVSAIFQTKIIDYPESLECIITHLKETNFDNFSIRKFMQYFGTDIMCNLVDKYYWIKEAQPFLRQNTVITDCRQPWEEEYFRKLNAKFIFVEGAYPGYKSISDSHITEHGLIPKEYDLILINKNINTLTKDIKCLLN